MDNNKNIGQRGKKAEADVRKILERLKSEKVDFDYERKYDARSSMGRIPSQTGDFGFFTPACHGIIEVKEVAHDFRLPRKNLGSEQIAKMHVRMLAGGAIVMLIYHSTTGAWRCPDFSRFLVQRDVPSWDLSDEPTFVTARAALETVQYGGDYIFR